MSNILSIFNPSPAPSSRSSTVAAPPASSPDCLACRITGTLTFSAVGIYALVQARRQAKTGFGRGAASVAGIGAFRGEGRGSELMRWNRVLGDCGS